MSEVHVGTLSSDVSFEDEAEGIETPRAEDVEALDRLDALRTKSARLRERTNARGFDD